MTKLTTLWCLGHHLMPCDSYGAKTFSHLHLLCGLDLYHQKRLVGLVLAETESYPQVSPVFFGRREFGMKYLFPPKLLEHIFLYGFWVIFSTYASNKDLIFHLTGMARNFFVLENVWLPRFMSTRGLYCSKPWNPNLSTYKHFLAPKERKTCLTDFDLLLLHGWQHKSSHKLLRL